MKLCGKSICSCDASLDWSIMVDPLSYFSFQPVLHDWCNKGDGMCYPVCRIMHIKELLLLITKSSLCARSPLSLWSFTICLTHITVNNVLSVSLNKTFPSFLKCGYEMCYIYVNVYIMVHFLTSSWPRWRHQQKLLYPLRTARLVWCLVKTIMD